RVLLAHGVQTRRMTIVESGTREFGLDEEANSAAHMRPKSGGEPAAVGKAEVDQPYASIRRDERVARMDVAVQHTSLMKRSVCVEQAACQLEPAAGLAAREKRMCRPRDVAPLQPLDRKVRTAVDLAGPNQLRGC